MAFTGNYVCNSFLSGILDGNFNFGPGTADVYRIAIYDNSATLNADTSVYTTEGEVSALGYPAGGPIVTPVKGIGDISSSGGTSFVNFSDVTVPASFTARGALIYKDGGAAICVLDFGSDKTSTNFFTVTFPTADAKNALIRVS
jgi:hypothetical protein